MATPTPTELEALIRRNLPRADHHGEVVEEATDSSLRLRLPFDRSFVGDETWGSPGGDSDLRVFSGPIVMGLADTAMYACCLAGFGPDVVPVMQSYTINFLRPALATDLIAEARIVRRGRRSSYLECWLTSERAAEAASHVTSVYAIRDTNKN